MRCFSLLARLPPCSGDVFTYRFVVSLPTINMELENFERVAITDDDDNLVILIANQADDTPDQSLCLVGRFLTDRTIQILIMRVRMVEI